jgi:fructose-1-phosphate kinase PfkB-like protein
VDTSGAALDVNGINVKVNADELGDSLGVEISNAEQAQKASAQLYKKGVALVVVTMGKEGALLNADGGVWFTKPPEIKVVSSVGSGDAFLSGLTFALESGHSLGVALRYAVATGSANALHLGGGKVQKKEIEGLFDKSTLE